MSSERKAWTVPLEWDGETAFIVGGGPSLKGFDWDRLRGKRTIAINNSGFRMPWADVLYWADARWYKWNVNRLHEFKGKYLVTRQAPDPDIGLPIKVLNHHFTGLSHVPDTIAGWCSGSNAINLAYLLGARQIVLLGFDMTGGNYHDEHQIAPIEDYFKLKFIPAIELMAKKLALTDTEVVNATPNSQLKCFPSVKFDDISDNNSFEIALK